MKGERTLLETSGFFFALKFMGEIHDDSLQADEKITGQE